MRLTAEARSIYLRGVVWLLFLAPFFFITYGQVNSWTATREDVGSLVFDWERHIPFIPWTIVPYWSLDLLYGLSLFVCSSVHEQTRLAWRLIAASLVACAGFLLFPLRFSFIRPELEPGLASQLFRQLEQFDLPYNQAPSLHIMLSWLLWLHFSRHLSRAGRILSGVWFMLIALSVLTTWQHHIIDVITGAAAGVVVGYLISYHGRWRITAPDRRRLTLGLRYLALAALLAVMGYLACPLLWWPGVGALCIALGYLCLGVEVFNKNARGKQHMSARLLLWPCRAVAQLSAYLWGRHLPQVSPVVQGLTLSGWPRSALAETAVLDLSAELPRSHYTLGKEYVCVPLLDLVTPEIQALQQAVDALEKLTQRHSAVRVHCALGLSRSALVSAAWLLKQGKALTPAAALGMVRACRTQVVIRPEDEVLLEQWFQQNPRA